MKTVLPIDPDYLLYLLIYQAQYAIYRARSNELMKIGITPEESGVLFAIHYIESIGGQTTSSEISRRLFRAPHSVSALVNRMKRRGLVNKSRDSKNRTMVRVMMTEKGRQAFEWSTKREAIKSLMSLLSEEERKQLGACLEKLMNGALKKLGMDDKLPYLFSQQGSQDEASHHS